MRFLRQLVLLSIVLFLHTSYAQIIQPPKDGGDAEHFHPIRQSFHGMEYLTDFSNDETKEDEYRAEIDRLLREIQEDWNENEREYARMRKEGGIVFEEIREYD
ncbi:hypothetical protein PMAYCL1PPCAC_25755 [Pristionchus mayeri]|uniref:Uncharacterized protein n=1 Tax=Pristionchus mayeri TaxID=1317129 RepID=A0AAN5I912_9BILA|nr:hypothetical protein PMAYCL1PPCAC_25755 [Pristionchus mayeri]